MITLSFKSKTQRQLWELKDARKKRKTMNTRMKGKWKQCEGGNGKSKRIKQPTKKQQQQNRQRYAGAWTSR